MSKKILLINGHPNKESYCQALSNAYGDAAQNAGHDVKRLHLHELDFELNFKYGYSKRQDSSADILEAQKLIAWAEHLVIVHPVWWGSVPALLKGFIDTAFLPGFAFKYKENSVWWDKLLSGKTARIIYTSDTPVWVYKYVYGQPSVRQLKARTLQFCGIQQVKVLGIGPIRRSSQEFRNKGLEKVAAVGATGL